MHACALHALYAFGGGGGGGVRLNTQVMVRVPYILPGIHYTYYVNSRPWRGRNCAYYMHGAKLNSYEFFTNTCMHIMHMHALTLHVLSLCALYVLCLLYTCTQYNY